MHETDTLHPAAFNFVMSAHLVVGCVLAIHSMAYGMQHNFDGAIQIYLSICLLFVGIAMSTSKDSGTTTSLGFGIVIVTMSMVFLPMLAQREILNYGEFRTCLYLVAATLACVGISGTLLSRQYARLQNAVCISTLAFLPALILFESAGAWMRVVAILAAYYLAFAMYLHAERRPKTLGRALHMGPKGYLVIFKGCSLVLRKMGFRPLVIDYNDHP